MVGKVIFGTYGTFLEIYVCMYVRTFKSGWEGDIWDLHF